MTPADLIRAKAKSYKSDAYRMAHTPSLANHLPDVENTWPTIYLAIGRALDDVADELEVQP